jgi:hypothetical protein
MSCARVLIQLTVKKLLPRRLGKLFVNKKVVKRNLVKSVCLNKGKQLFLLLLCIVLGNAVRAQGPTVPLARVAQVRDSIGRLLQAETSARHLTCCEPFQHLILYSTNQRGPTGKAFGATVLGFGPAPRL